MVTMLDCIKRTASASLKVFDHAISNTDRLAERLADKMAEIREIIIVASGSSQNAAMVARRFMEKVTGLQVNSFLPNDYKRKTVFPKDALYVFVSQSGTSALLEEMLIETNERGCFTVSVTDDAGSPISQKACVDVPLLVGGEEFGYRTVGFCCSFLILQVIALRIGLERGFITRAQFDEYLEDGRKAAANHPLVVEKTLKWFAEHKECFAEAKSFIYYGSDSLFGIAVEAALKLLETARVYLSIGYEAEDGLHGPNLGFNKGDVVIALCDGRTDAGYATSVANFAKNELGQGYIFGQPAIDSDDLAFECCSENFVALEMAPAVEIVAYELAVLRGVPVHSIAERVPHSSAKYFQMHSDKE